MEMEEKEHSTDKEEYSQNECCDFSSEEASRMFKMMKEYCGDSEKGSSECHSMMRNMSSKSNSCC